MVGSETNQTAVPPHKLVLGMASPVFEAMFYGALSERNDPIVQIPDVQPEAFRALLQYIYTGNTDIGSFNMACDLWYGAKKYMLPHLVKECNRYVCSVLDPTNVCRAYEFACLFDEKTLMDNCIKIISTNTKEVLNASSFEEVQLNTLMTVLSLDQLEVDSELDLFHAVARYAEAEQKRQGPVRPSEEPSEKLVSPSGESSSQTSPAAELDSKPPAEVVTAEPIADEENVEEEKPTIRGALQKIRFLSLTVQQFAEGPALSDLLTEADSFAVFMNMASRDTPVPMPTGFTVCREQRCDSKAQCFKAGCWDHIIKALKCGIPSQVKEAAEAAEQILDQAPEPRIQQALDKGILDALGSVLTKGDDECKHNAASAVFSISYSGSPAQCHALAEAAALQPFCSLLGPKKANYNVMPGLKNILLEVDEENTRLVLLRKLREFGVPRLLITVQQDSDEEDRKLANELLLYFHNEQ